jgi:Na+/melibiose symporter-like transporter
MDQESTGTAAPIATAPPPSVWTKLAYGLGAIAPGVKDNGLSYFLLIFYSQVIGVDARLVGLAITASLIFDAFIDPIVGYWSDNLRSRWGRRHPFMYAAAIPIAGCFFMLWNPPHNWTQTNLAVYLLILLVLVRGFASLYETPSSALAPELTNDYDQRSSLLSYRYYFAWTGGNAMSVLMFAALFPAFATAAIPNGQFNRDAYALYGVLGAGLIFLSIAISSLGTHARIAHFRVSPPRRELTLGKIFKEIIETVSNRSFLALFVSAIFGAVASGVSTSLAFYMLTYFWKFSSQQTSLVTISVFISAVIGSLMAPLVTRTIGKRRGAIIIGLIAFIGSPLPIVLRLAHILPGETTPFVFWFVLISGMIDVGLIICFQILSASMMSDLVEQAEVKTGRRSEGVFFSSSTFIGKLVGGLGVVAATFVLTMAGLPAGADPAHVSDGTLWRLGAFYVPTILTLWMAMMAAIWTYNLDRGGHDENLRKLAARAGGTAPH